MKKFVCNLCTVALSLMTIFPAIAAPAATVNRHDSVVPVQLKFVGNIQQNPVFELSILGHAQDNDFVVTVKDQWGVALFRENVKRETFSKKFLINTDEIGDDPLRFEITNRRTGNTISYEINRYTRQVEQWLVSK